MRGSRTSEGGMSQHRQEIGGSKHSMKSVSWKGGTHRKPDMTQTTYSPVDKLSLRASMRELIMNQRFEQRKTTRHPHREGDRRFREERGDLPRGLYRQQPETSPNENHVQALQPLGPPDGKTGYRSPFFRAPLYRRPAGASPTLKEWEECKEIQNALENCIGIGELEMIIQKSHPVFNEFNTHVALQRLFKVRRLKKQLPCLSEVSL